MRTGSHYAGALVALSRLEVVALMQPDGPAEVTLADLFPPRPAWMARGACREPHPEADWFATTGAALEAAVAVCAGCPVRGPCGEYAAANPELVGIWAGTTPQERPGRRRRKAS